MRNKNIICLVFALLLCGCTTVTDQSDYVDSKKPSPFLTQDFIATGKAALRYPHCDPYRGCKQKAYSANINWRHDGSGDEITFYDPTGQQVLKLHYQDQQVIIQDSEGERVVSADALEREYEMKFPIEKFRQWFFVPSTSNELTDTDWHVQLEKWQGAYYQRLTLKNKDHYLRIFIKKISVL